MTREMAVLGIPTISVYQDELLDVDRFLLQHVEAIHRLQHLPVDVLREEQLEQRVGHVLGCPGVRMVCLDLDQPGEAYRDDFDVAQYSLGLVHGSFIAIVVFEAHFRDERFDQ